MTGDKPRLMRQAPAFGRMRRIETAQRRPPHPLGEAEESGEGSVEYARVLAGEGSREQAFKVKNQFHAWNCFLT